MALHKKNIFGHVRNCANITFFAVKIVSVHTAQFNRYTIDLENTVFNICISESDIKRNIFPSCIQNKTVKIWAFAIPGKRLFYIQFYAFSAKS